MFVYFTDDDGTRIAIAKDSIFAVYGSWIYFKPDYNNVLGSSLLINDSQYTEIIRQLELIDNILTFQPTSPVGEPLRGIVGEALQEFMNTKGRTD
jgi:hypothetical protein